MFPHALLNKWCAHTLTSFFDIGVLLACSIQHGVLPMKKWVRSSNLMLPFSAIHFEFSVPCDVSLLIVKALHTSLLLDGVSRNFNELKISHFWSYLKSNGCPIVTCLSMVISNHLLVRVIDFVVRRRNTNDDDTDEVIIQMGNIFLTHVPVLLHCFWLISQLITSHNGKKLLIKPHIMLHLLHGYRFEYFTFQSNMLTNMVNVHVKT